MEKWSVILILGVVILMYAFLIMRQRRQTKRSQELMESFKVGDKVMTHIGIFGKIKRIYNTSYGKICILEIGEHNKLDIEIDMRYIAGIDEKVAVTDEIEKEVVEDKEILTENEEIKEEKEEQLNQDKENKNSKKRK